MPDTFLTRRGTSTEWSSAQTSSSISITAISYSSGVITYTAANTLTANQYITVTGATSWQYNGTFQVASRTSSQFTVNWTLASSGTTSTATAYTPLLDAGEVGYETDTKMFKIGDGKRVWDYLPYYNQHKTIGVVRYLTNSYFYNMNMGGTSSASHAITTNNGWYTPIEIPSTTKISTMGIWRTTAGTGVSLAMGIYNHNYTTNLPGTLRHNAGPITVTVPAATTKYDASLSENGNSYITLLPGIYWVCTAAVDAAITLLVCQPKSFHTTSNNPTSTSVYPGSYTVTTTLSSGVLPTTSPVVAGSNFSNFVDRIAFLVA